MEYLVTGGAGFIGSNLVEALLRRGDRVRVFDNFSTGKRENLTEVWLEVFGSEQADASRLEVIEGDLRDREAVARAVKEVRFVLHQAALPSVPRSVDDPLTSNDVNITGTLNLLVAARDAGVERIVLASSSSVYGGEGPLPKKETMPTAPRSPYAVSKDAGERYARVFHALYGTETVSLRYFNVFGPRQDPLAFYSAVIPKFIGLLLRNESPVIYGDGEQTRDFTYVANAVHANLLAVSEPRAKGEVFNIAAGGSTTVTELANTLKRLVGSFAAITYDDPRPGDVRHSYADISKARETLGYRREVSLSEGLEKTVDYFRGRLL